MKIGRQMLVLFFMMVALSACNVTNKQNEANERSLVQVKNTADEKITNKSGQAIAKHLATLANRVPNVNDATAVVVGKYAIVGIDVNSNIDASRVGTIKYSVAESLQKDPYGANAIIIADPDLYARLNNIAKQVDNGRPVQSFMNELADIVGRVMPEVPSDLFNQKNEQPTKENDSQLNKREEQQLNNRQEQQSNDYLNK
ncbi:YhcN/YlaJ family sporulation lipoprotein [Anoxybacillus caldiproteolyticus]|uniref:YhcN/YlaJ family sporulation lipoprotein n=2 Tax=Thermaerobacillus caldiproteolyticus TaxID=247480 RepID=A0A7W0BX29_9BACL|nr:YhcN/YlaJ family sporulation lipoprotein [Anoxybacillus caldiproteolyticus]QPA31918.1 YhcN/YlaJ family sporulation lipoprotein [Anoxybacillus caldiproteolyticus]